MKEQRVSHWAEAAEEAEEAEEAGAPLVEVAAEVSGVQAVLSEEAAGDVLAVPSAEAAGAAPGVDSSEEEVGRASLAEGLPAGGPAGSSEEAGLAFRERPWWSFPQRGGQIQ